MYLSRAVSKNAKTTPTERSWDLRASKCLNDSLESFAAHLLMQRSWETQVARAVFTVRMFSIFVSKMKSRTALLSSRRVARAGSSSTLALFSFNNCHWCSLCPDSPFWDRRGRNVQFRDNGYTLLTKLLSNLC